MIRSSKRFPGPDEEILKTIRFVLIAPSVTPKVEVPAGVKSNVRMPVIGLPMSIVYARVGPPETI